MKHVCLSLFIALTALLIPTSWALEGKDKSVDLQWSFNGKLFTWTSQFAGEDMAYYRNRPHPQGDSYSAYATDTVDDRYITDLAKQFQLWMDQLEMTEPDRINFVAAFVQSLSGSTDNSFVAVPDQAPRYPMETLIDKGGNSEDTAILAAAILQQFNHEVALIRLGNHMGVGVVCNHCKGDYFFHEDTEYIYLETTGQRWELGQLPPQYEDSDFEVFPLIPQAVIDFDFDYKEVASSSPRKRIEITVWVQNNGSATADNLKILASCSAEEEQVYSEVVSDLQSLNPEDKLTSTVTLFVPKKIATRIQVTVSGDNFTTRKLESEKLTVQ